MFLRDRLLRPGLCGLTTTFKALGLDSSTPMSSEGHLNPLWPLAVTSRPPTSKTLYSCFRKLENTRRDDRLCLEQTL